MADRGRVWPVLVLVAVVGCGPEGRGEVSATEHCAEPENPPLQSGAHLIGDAEPPVPWNSTPPTSGWHASGTFEIGISDAADPLPEAQQVSVLEVGGVVIAYHDLADAEVTALTEHVVAHHAGRVAVTPYERIDPGEVTFTSWGELQRCDGLDLEALDAFAGAHAVEDPPVPGHG